MRPESFRHEFARLVHGFLWRQWERVGVAGAEGGNRTQLIDPEALLLFSLEICRTEPRLYDESLDWLTGNERLLNIQRLRNILRRDQGFDIRLLARAARLLQRHNRSAKWRSLVPTSPAEDVQPFFYSVDGRCMPVPEEKDSCFLEAGWLRSPVRLRGYTRRVSFVKPSLLVFRLRSLFGVNLRAELIAYLLTHSEGHPNELSGVLFFSQPAVYEACREMTLSGLLSPRNIGREKRYRIDQSLWTAFLGLSSELIPDWVAWQAVFQLLIQLWRFLCRENWEDASDYIQSSEIKQLCRLLAPISARTGLNVNLTRIIDGEIDDILQPFFSEIRNFIGLFG